MQIKFVGGIFRKEIIDKTNYDLLGHGRDNSGDLIVKFWRIETIGLNFDTVNAYSISDPDLVRAVSFSYATSNYEIVIVYQNQNSNGIDYDTMLAAVESSNNIPVLRVPYVDPI